MGINRKWFFIYFILLSLPPGLKAQAPTFQASLNAREVLAGGYFEVSFTLENGKGSDFSAPDFGTLQVVAGPSQSSQISIINGVRSQKLMYGYTLLAARPGTYTIGPASIRVGKDILKTRAITIKVLPAGTQGSKRASGEDIFVRAELSDTLAYPGQQLLLSYVLYFSRSQVRGYDFLRFPVLDGFHAEEVNTRQGMEIRVIDGREYQSTTIRSIAIFPQKLGRLFIEEAQVSLSVLGRNDPFTFFGSSKAIPVITNSLSVEVVPLPDGAPATFRGAIGKFEMQSSINSRSVTTDDAITLKVSIQGTGLARFIEAPELDGGNDFEVYDPRVVDEQVYATQQDVSSRKSFEYLLVPLNPGRKKLQVAFSYFDTDSLKYVTLNSPRYTIEVGQGREKGRNLSPEELLEKYQLRPPSVSTGISRADNGFFGSAGWWILMGMILLAIPVVAGVKGYQRKQGRIDPAQRRKTRAMATARKRLAVANQALDAADARTFYKALSDALQKYVADKFSIQTKDFTRERVRQILIDQELDAASADKYLGLLDRCEQALFSGFSNAVRTEFYEESVSIITELEQSLEKSGRKRDR